MAVGATGVVSSERGVGVSTGRCRSCASGAHLKGRSPTLHRHDAAASTSREGGERRTRTQAHDEDNKKER